MSEKSVVSDSNAEILLALPIGYVYQFRTFDGGWQDFTVPNAGSTTIPEVLR